MQRQIDIAKREILRHSRLGVMKSIFLVIVNLSCLFIMIGGYSLSRDFSARRIHGGVRPLNVKKGGGSNKGVLPALQKQLQYHDMKADRADAVMKLAEKAVSEWTTTTTAFLSPSEVNAVETAFRDVVDVSVDFSGGYAQATRKVGIFRRQDEWRGEEGAENEAEEWRILGEDMDAIFALVQIDGNFLLDKATDEDFKDSILTLSHVSQDSIGDIVVTGERGAQVLALSQTAEDIISGLKQVRTVPVTCSRVELDELKVRAKVVKELSCVEASTRLDAIGSAGLGISRSRMVKVVEAGDVTVNFKQVKSSSTALRTGDVVMAKNIGRLDIVEVGETRKGKVRAKVVKTV